MELSSIGIAAGFGIGLAGSLHCLGMCGPIALAVPVHRSGKLAGALLYNGGRVLTYAIMGLVLGLFSRQLVMIGWQQSASIVLGVLVLLMAFVPSLANKLSPSSAIARGTGKLKSALGYWLKKRSAIAIAVLGMLNGLLPCGLVYLALAGALVSGGAINGAAYMAAFGLGTAPALASVMLLGSAIKPAFRARMRKAVPYVIALTGLLLILRGAGLGIPYLSPQLQADAPHKTCCHAP